MRKSFSSIGVHIDAATGVHCHTYPASVPIVVMRADGWSLALAPVGYSVVEGDVITARRLATVIGTYVAEMERLYLQQFGRSVPDSAG